MICDRTMNVALKVPLHVVTANIARVRKFLYDALPHATRGTPVFEGQMRGIVVSASPYHTDKPVSDEQHAQLGNDDELRITFTEEGVAIATLLVTVHIAHIVIGSTIDVSITDLPTHEQDSVFGSIAGGSCVPESTIVVAISVIHRPRDHVFRVSDVVKAKLLDAVVDRNAKLFVSATMLGIR